MPYELLLSPKEISEVIELYKAGNPKCSIARKYRVSPQVIHYYIKTRQETYIPPKEREGLLTVDQRKEIIELYKQKLKTKTELAKQFGVSWQLIHYFLKTKVI